MLKIKEVNDSTCINRLMALEGAIQNIRWYDLSDDDKNNLKEFYNNFNIGLTLVFTYYVSIVVKEIMYIMRIL